jgi:acetyltransferase-like isoleucine patch superfamily enzyme
MEETREIHPTAVIKGVIDAVHVRVGRGVVVEEGVLISGKAATADRVVLGDYSYVGHNVRVLAPEFLLGDYSKLHAGSFGHGKHPLRIGRNCWIGGDVVLDAMAGLDIDDNVGIGAHSQLWTHMEFGDIVDGCRFYSHRYMHIRRDAWFVGHCIVSPVSVGERSMALAGSVVTREMLPNHVYAGVPAADVTEQMGTQFEPRTPAQKAARLHEILGHWLDQSPQWRDEIIVVEDPAQRRNDVTWFDVSTRTYNKRHTAAEVAFLRDHIPLLKFLPEGVPHFFQAGPPDNPKWAVGEAPPDR